MAGTFTDYGANQLLDGNGLPTGLWVQFHTGTPGDGTTNISPDSGSGNRVAYTRAPAVSRITSNTAPVELNITVDQQITHWSLWDAVSGGNCWWVGDWDQPVSYFASDIARVPVGALDLIVV